MDHFISLIAQLCFKMVSSRVALPLAFLTLLLVSELSQAQKCSSCTACCYYVFTLSWVQATCKMEDKSQNVNYVKTCKATLPKTITIHGLWPQLTDSTSQLSYCTDSTEKFNVTKLSSIKSQLTTVWPTAFTGTGQSDESFWKHEWDKHGTCSPLTMTNYFQRSLSLNTKYPINSWLSSGGIVPSNSKLYTVAQVKTAFTKHIKADQYVLKCVSVKGGLQILKDVMLCVSNADTTTLVTCSSVKSTCADKFFLIENFKNPIA